MRYDFLFTTAFGYTNSMADHGMRVFIGCFSLHFDMGSLVTTSAVVEMYVLRLDWDQCAAGSMYVGFEMPRSKAVQRIGALLRCKLCLYIRVRIKTVLSVR